MQIAHGVLRRALNDAVRDELLPRNVGLLVKPSRVDSPAPQPLRPEEIRALLTEAQHDRLYPLWLLLVTLGLRRGEALALRWTDVDLDQGTLTVARSLERIRTRRAHPQRSAPWPPRRGASQDHLKHPPHRPARRLVDALTAHRQQHAERASAPGSSRRTCRRPGTSYANGPACVAAAPTIMPTTTCGTPPPASSCCKEPTCA